MAYTRIPGGVWLPTLPQSWGTVTQYVTVSDSLTLDADEEEAQLFGRVYLAAGSGSKTFGTGGSKIGWLPGASITFAANSTLRVGIKKASTIDIANGPAARATIGAAAFDVYDDLVGGTDTITATTWREDTMSAGTPFAVSHGDLVSICFHLDTTSGTPSVKVRANTFTQASFPVSTLVTSGPTYSVANSPIAVITFDDGTIGWLEGAFVHSGVSSEAIGNTNLYGNIIRLPFAAKVDAIATLMVSAGTTDWDFGFYSTPLGTPAAMSGGVVAVDPQVTGSTRSFVMPLASEITLAPGTDYALAVKQNSATGLTVLTHDVDNVAHFQANGLDSTCYAAKSTAGASFSAQNSSKRRSAVFFRVSQIDTGKPGFVGG
jgi:hypothetical protein